MGCKKTMGQETNETLYERGQVYDIRYDDSVGAEMAVGRPVLIISCEESNKTGAVTVAYMSTVPHKRNFSVKVWTGKKWGHVVCNQLHTVDVSRFGDFICKLTNKDVSRVDTALKYTLCLNDVEMMLSKKCLRTRKMSYLYC